MRIIRNMAGTVHWNGAVRVSAWNSGPTTASKRIVFHDELRAGSSFNAVEPGCLP